MPTNIGLHSSNEALLNDLYSKFPKVKPYLKTLTLQSGTWSKEIITNCFKILQLDSGCGCMLFSKYYMLQDSKEMVNCLKYVFSLFELNGTCGTFITTLGDAHKGSKKFIEAIGFKEVAYYPNVKHGNTTPSQKLYVLTL